MIAVLFIVGIVAAGLAIGFAATATAPVGFQDDTGFHYGPDHEEAEYPVTVAHPRPA